MPTPFNDSILMFPSATMPNDRFFPHVVTTTTPWLTSSVILWCSISSTGNVNVSSPPPLLATPFHSSVLRPLAVPLHRPVAFSSLPDYFLDETSNVYIDELQRTWDADYNTGNASWDMFFLPITGQSLQEILQPLHIVHAYQITRPMNAYLDPLHLTHSTGPSPVDPEAYLDHAISAETIQ
ncbi:hypothetical protein KP509_36G049300 [Ceratopteris richardii]|uniref:Uncharacterized protein n=1 Tax=Ceratopteris richardii TaxID=49495 RepID=A0A8T2QDC9_CERRI|nr:hypothetical protein KP509_36G049300 [Ceratopteris richardii]